MFGIGWDLLQPKGNIIAPIVFIPAKKNTPKIRGSFAIKPSDTSMLKAIYATIKLIKFVRTNSHFLVLSFIHCTTTEVNFSKHKSI